MARFMTFKRWALKDVGEESELLRLVREKILPAYMKLPGCLGLGLLRIEGTRSYLAIQYWESKAAREAAISSHAYSEWFNAYKPTLEEWHTIARLEEEWECQDVLVCGERFVVERHEEPVAAVVPTEVYEQWKEARGAFFARVRAASERADLPSDDAEALADEAVGAVRSITEE